ncbi:MetQ/NlpA family ABC transporter substrate-binding protein [Bombilactobacillus thymidiniphilus]|uniref:Lipoprotein n=1 Tax=Bombilactobacillus thymidiniphilus TaxID=2923363 RepID=A0ABY4PDE8_9LACO|nr:MetQ/NlpA family ABC transporter substrate-binding protein [Bombilactobacillus thymidiniphilus]UQS83699.1 MetQ/NlpA family ABC transporter substrate-binding protein [Bombilactobacillus thymidiniphilus]
MKKNKFLRILLGLSLLSFLVVVAGCGKQQAKEETVKVGINNADASIWKIVQQKVKKEHINLKIVEFSDYNQPNTALSQGELNINAFQHRYFLKNWNQTHHTDLVAIGDTVIQPMTVYSNKLTSLKQLKSNAKVAIPNDASNEARAIELLESAGLIKLSNTKGKLPDIKDVKDNKLHLKLEILDAAQTAHSLEDMDAAVINGNVASAAKLSPKKQIYKEKVSKQSKPWVNVIVANKKDKNNPTYKKIVKAYQSKAVEKQERTIYGKDVVSAWKVKF